MKELYTALLKAKRSINPPSKNRKAMYGRYADLEAILQAVEGPLANEGLLIVQSVRTENGSTPFLQTRLVHAETGQELTSELPLVTKDPNDPQKLGGSITYARRYGITALINIVADDDDDGNTAAGRNKDGSPQKKQSDSGKGVTQEQIKEVFEIPNALPEKIVLALIDEYKRADFKDGEIVPEIKALLSRDFAQIAELTEAEARTAAGHARKIKRGDSGRLT